MSSPTTLKNHGHIHDHGTKMAIAQTKNVGHYGSVKKVIEKRGGAGRGAWGKPGSEAAASGVKLNSSDPNFDDYNDGNVVIDNFTLLASGDLRRLAIKDLIHEYIESGDVSEALSDLNAKKNIDALAPDLIEASVIFGIEHHAYERELISQLLSAAHEILEGKGYEEGFQRVLYNLPDLTLDNPNAAEFFMARAMYDEVLPPKFMKDAIVENEPAKLAMSLAFNMENNANERSRLEHIWGPASLTSVDRLREEVNVILKEYLESHDISEADRAIAELNSPSFKAQIVKQALYTAIESGNHRPRQLIMALLSSWAKSQVISDYHLFHGFELAVRNIEEIKLDVPHAEEILSSLIDDAKKHQLLSSTFHQ